MQKWKSISLALMVNLSIDSNVILEIMKVIENSIIPAIFIVG